MIKPDIVELDSPSVWDAYGTQDISGYDPVITYTTKVYPEWAYKHDFITDWPQSRWRFQTHLSPHCDWSVHNTVYTRSCRHDVLLWCTYLFCRFPRKGLIQFIQPINRDYSLQEIVFCIQTMSHII